MADSSAALPPGVSWEQDDDSVEVTVAVPDEAVRADLRVNTTAEKLTVLMRAADAVWRPVITGSLRHAVEQESCCWALEKLRKGGGKAVVIQLEKQTSQIWDALLRASTEGSILEELGRDQVIVDAGASTAESLVCGRCGALVKASRMEAHTTMWCDALVADGGGADADAGAGASACGEAAETAKSPAAHLYWAREPTNPAGPGPNQKLAVEEGEIV